MAKSKKNRKKTDISPEESAAQGFVDNILDGLEEGYLTHGVHIGFDDLEDPYWKKKVEEAVTQRAGQMVCPFFLRNRCSRKYHTCGNNLRY